MNAKEFGITISVSETERGYEWFISSNGRVQAKGWRRSELAANSDVRDAAANLVSTLLLDGKRES